MTQGYGYYAVVTLDKPGGLATADSTITIYQIPNDILIVEGPVPATAGDVPFARYTEERIKAGLSTLGYRYIEGTGQAIARGLVIYVEPV